MLRFAALHGVIGDERATGALWMRRASVRIRALGELLAV